MQAILTFDFWYKLLSLGISAGIFTSIFTLVRWAITLEPRLKAIEKQTTQYGTMFQQFTTSIAHIEGILEGFKGWDGNERRNKGDKTK